MNRQSPSPKASSPEINGNEFTTADDQCNPARQLFFRELHILLQNESPTGYIQWRPDNKSFIISDKDRFENTVLPRYFGSVKYTSFTRRMKRWGIRRTAKGADSGAYFHEQLHRGMRFEEEDYDVVTSTAHDSSCLDRKSDSPSALPLKKRTRWTPPQGESNGSIPVAPSQHNDVLDMQQLMREINRNKRLGVSPPEAKRARVDQSVLDETRPSLGLYNNPFNSLLDSSAWYPSELHQEQLARVNAQVMERNLRFGIDTKSMPMTSNAHQDFLLPARRDLTRLSTDLLRSSALLRALQSPHPFVYKQGLFNQDRFGYTQVFASNHSHLARTHKISSEEKNSSEEKRNDAFAKVPLPHSSPSQQPKIPINRAA